MSFYSEVARRRQCQMSSLHCTVSSHDESLPDTGEERRGVGCVSWSWSPLRSEAFSLHHQLLLTGGLGTNGRRGWCCVDQSEARPGSAWNICLHLTLHPHAVCIVIRVPVSRLLSAGHIDNAFVFSYEIIQIIHANVIALLQMYFI